MSHFAAVAAVRIQPWLSRTPDLRYVRGASRALSEETSREHLKDLALLHPGVDYDPDAADIDGVCALRSADANALDDSVESLLNHLQIRLPGIEWSAWRVEADSYVSAYNKAHNDDPSWNGRRWRRLPVLMDLPIAAACAHCAHEMAVREVPVPGEKEKKKGVGLDCFHRYKYGPTTGFQDFDELAEVGKKGHTIGRRDAANHLATVCADGNRVGGFFKALSDLADSEFQANLSNALERAVTSAAAKAAKCGPNGETVALTHFVGGDDIFASVAAPFAWQYVETLGREFEESFKTAVESDLPPGSLTEKQQAVLDAANEVSLGIGMAFAHANHPISECREAAQEAESFAKAATQGKRSAVTWTDLTVERLTGSSRIGPPKTEPSEARLPESVPSRTGFPTGRVVTVEQLTRDLADPQLVMLFDPSARGMLATLLREQPGDTPDLIAAGVRSWAVRVGRESLLDRYLPETRDTDALSPALADLRNTVDRVRWWPGSKPTDEVNAT